MTRSQTTTAGTETATNTSTSANAVSARILKKRETDRKCQRMIRERTKSRITYLEGIVEQFRSQDASGRVETLMSQLSDMKEERDMLAKQVKNIETIIRGNKLKEEPDTQNLSTIRLRSEESEQPPTPSVDTQHHPLPTDEFTPPVFAVHNKEFQAYLGERSSRSSWAVSTLQTAPTTPCECSSHHSALDPAKPLNKWRYANETLTEWFKWSPQALDMARYTAYNDDVPVRAIVEGWNAVEQHGNMHPAWRLLHGIDQNIFSSCEPTERLAILTVMGLLLQAHLNPTTEQHQKLPAFYLKRPSQDMLHSYATEYFAWPGLRERFVFSEHRYCSNVFWRLFCKNLRFLWPFEFRDCYVRNVETGLYKISPTFHERINDISCWTMGRGMFEQWPELYSDMPTWNHIPGSLAPVIHVPRQTRLTLPGPRSATDTTETSRSRYHGGIQILPRGQEPDESHAHQLHRGGTEFPAYASPSANTSFDSSTTTISAYDFTAPNIASTMTDLHSIAPTHSWGLHGSLDMYQPNPT